MYYAWPLRSPVASDWMRSTEGGGSPGAGRSIPRTEETRFWSLGHVHFPSGVVSSLWPIDWEAEQWAAAAWQGDRTLGARDGTAKELTGHQDSCTRWSEDVFCGIWQLEGDSSQHPMILKLSVLSNPTPPPSRLSDGPNFKLKKQTNKSGILYPWGLFWFLKWRVYEWVRMS